MRLIRTHLKEDLDVNLLAKAIGISETSYYKYERGDRTPTIRSLSRISKSFGLDAHILLKKDLTTLEVEYFKKQGRSDKPLGEILAEKTIFLLEEYEISKHFLEKNAGVSYQTLTSLLAGGENGTLKTLEKIYGNFGIHELSEILKPISLSRETYFVEWQEVVTKRAVVSGHDSDEAIGMLFSGKIKDDQIEVLDTCISDEYGDTDYGVIVSQS